MIRGLWRIVKTRRVTGRGAKQRDKKKENEIHNKFDNEADKHEEKREKIEKCVQHNRQRECWAININN